MKINREGINMWIIIVLVIIGAIGVWAVSTYNSLITVRERVDNEIGRAHV